MLGRLHRQYYDQGLRIVLVAKTAGYSPASPPQGPDEEGESIRRYFHEYLKLPFPILVETTPVTRKPDGRRVNGKTEFESAYHQAGTVLINRSGTIEFVSNVDIGGAQFLVASEAVLEAFIQRTLSKVERATYK